MKLKIKLIIVGILIILFLLTLNNNIEIGYYINKIFPCETIPDNSFPCFGIYDIYLMLILSIIITILGINIGIISFKKKKVNI